MLNKILLYYHTVRYLKPRQLFYQIWYRLKWNYFSFNYGNVNEIKFYCNLNDWNLPVLNNTLNDPGNLSFTFLNKNKKFDQIIDWNFLVFGKLWNYHLQYMDYLLDEHIPVSKREDILINLSKQIISKNLKLEPFPISLRLINSLIFVCKHSIKSEEISKAIGIQLSFLENNVEYHLLANHLLENYISLCFTYTVLHEKQKQEKCLKLLLTELDEQILKDGGHIERTPAYHALILRHLMQLIYLIEMTSVQIKEVEEIKRIASRMLGWYLVISNSGKHFPFFNDSAESNTFSFGEIQQMANHCNIKSENIKLNESGYRILKNEFITVIINSGNITPTYQAGHAHADILHFILYFKNKAILVDTGISTYENIPNRLLQKSTRMHNTVSFGEENQSQIWSSFRIAKRAIVKIIEDRESKLVAEVNWHNGMKHKRMFSISNESLLIVDSISNLPNTEELPIANFHFDNSLSGNMDLRKNELQIDELQIQFRNHIKVTREGYLQSLDFNKQCQAVKISAYFTGDLKTVISWKN